MPGKNQKPDGYINRQVFDSPSSHSETYSTIMIGRSVFAPNAATLTLPAIFCAISVNAWQQATRVNSQQLDANKRQA